MSRGTLHILSKQHPKHTSCLAIRSMGSSAPGCRQAVKNVVSNITCNPHTAVCCQFMPCPPLSEGSSTCEMLRVVQCSWPQGWCCFSLVLLSLHQQSGQHQRGQWECQGEIPQGNQDFRNSCQECPLLTESFRSSMHGCCLLIRHISWLRCKWIESDCRDPRAAKYTRVGTSSGYFWINNLILNLLGACVSLALV